MVVSKDYAKERYREKGRWKGKEGGVGQDNREEETTCLCPLLSYLLDLFHVAFDLLDNMNHAQVGSLPPSYCTNAGCLCPCLCRH